jgi:hypothetical protein
MKALINKFAISILLVFTFLPPILLAEDIDLFVLAGQSNMQGWQGNAENYPAGPNGIDKRIKFYWVTPQYSSSDGKWTFMQPQGGIFPKGHFGPEVTFSRLLINDSYNTAVFKYSLGSTSLAYDWKTPGENGMYDQMVAELKKAVILLHEQGHKVTLRALVWIQGESDAESKELADEYGDKLKLLIDHFRMKVAKDNRLPIILGVDEQHTWIKAFPKVLEAQQQIAKEDQEIMFTSMVGLEKADETHLTPRGLEEHGARLFAAYKVLTTKYDHSNSARITPGRSSSTSERPFRVGM